MADRRARADVICSTGKRCRRRAQALSSPGSGCASKHPAEEDSGMPENENAEQAELQSVGFLGLGIMVSRMAANVARAGYPLSVWTHTTGKAERWAAEHGASALSTPAEVAERSDIVVSMVVDGAQVASVLLGEHGVIDAAHPGLLCVDMSTIGP